MSGRPDQTRWKATIKTPGQKMDERRPENADVSLGAKVDEELGPSARLKYVRKPEDQQAQRGQDFDRAFHGNATPSVIAGEMRIYSRQYSVVSYQSGCD